MALSKPHTCYHGHREDALVRGNKVKRAKKIEEMKGGRTCMFHIKVLSVISALKNTEVEDFRHFTMAARACVEWRRGPNFFRLVAMVSPEVMGRNGSMFCAHLCQHLMRGLGLQGHQPQNELLRASTWHHAQQRDFTQPETE